MILTPKGEVVPAAKGVSGTLIVGEGCQITEERARLFGLMPPADEMPKQRPMVAPIVVRGPEGDVHLGGQRGGGLKIQQFESQPAAATESSGKPWEAAQNAEAANQVSPTSAPTDESGKALGLEEK